MDSFEHTTVSDIVVALTAGFYGDHHNAVISVETAPIRFRIDGQDPTAIIGHLLLAGEGIELESNDEIKKFRAIRTTVIDAEIMASYGNSPRSK